MCNDDHDHGVLALDPADDPVLNPGRWRPSRRTVLKGAAGGVAAVLGRGFLPVGSALAATPSNPFSAAPRIRAAMHVHGSWDEGQGSWESQFAQAGATGLVDVLYMSTHDYRAEAYNYLPTFAGVVFDAAIRAGSLSTGSVTNTNGTVRVQAQSANSSMASYGAPMQAKPMAANRLRTSIAGQSLAVSFTAVRVDAGGCYEVVIDLSNHPAMSGRPAGQYQLRYRFGVPAVQPPLDPSKVVGIVQLPLPVAGQQVTLVPAADVASHWPDMQVPWDNTFFMLTFVATSPAKGSITDVSVTGKFSRTLNDPADLTSLHQQLIAAYGPRYPNLVVYPTQEVSRFDPLHVIGFGIAQEWYDQSKITKPTVNPAYTAYAAHVHSLGGLVSMNHPFGPSDALVSPSGMEALRQSTYAKLGPANFDAADILEVGYTKRGGADTPTHLALWDTAGRNGQWLTGTGVNDDHGGTNWPNLPDGFVTAMWGGSQDQADLVTALAGGRVYTYHPARWAAAQLDTELEDGTRMGQASSSSSLARTMSIYAPGVAKAASVQVVVCPVDMAGNVAPRPQVTTISGSKFPASGVASVPLSISGPCFARVQVVLPNGNYAAIGNPTWMLPTVPAGMSIPETRINATL